METAGRPADHARSQWRAVAARDRAADGHFVYAVRSTGVYCRPSCPSRRPQRARVAFFETPAEAERAGFRACRRCRPNETPPFDPWRQRIRLACAYLATVDGHPSLAALGRRFGSSPYHFQRTFKRVVGLSPRQYAEACRVAKVRHWLRQGAAVTAAVVEAGYGSNSRFYERAVARFGMRPAIYRRGGMGMSVRFTIVDSPVGRLLVAATARGVCAVSMGSSDAALRRALADEYPHATIVKDRGALTGWTEAILAHLEGRRPRLDLPLDVQATAFQWQVWAALAAIPPGETRSYREVASTIGRPTAARAVARACATNPVAIAIPCHRVVPSAGGVGGYRWGSSRKKALLAAEGRMPKQ
jgi:AraC family transcriptional regulator of adaptative response/methylated-DNA-[protein]-cysteine methyltransferase